MGEQMDAEQAHEFYKDPANLVPAGPGRRPKRPAALSSTVPVRFPRELIAAVRRLADQDEMTVSAWIRRVVGKEVRRREPPRTVTIAAEPILGEEIEGTQEWLSTRGTGQPELLAS